MRRPPRSGLSLVTVYVMALSGGSRLLLRAGVRYKRYLLSLPFNGPRNDPSWPKAAGIHPYLPASQRSEPGMILLEVHPIFRMAMRFGSRNRVGGK